MNAFIIFHAHHDDLRLPMTGHEVAVEFSWIFLITLDNSGRSSRTVIKFTIGATSLSKVYHIAYTITMGIKTNCRRSVEIYGSLSIRLIIIDPAARDDSSFPIYRLRPKGGKDESKPRSDLHAVFR